MLFLDLHWSTWPHPQLSYSPPCQIYSHSLGIRQLLKRRSTPTKTSCMPMSCSSTLCTVSREDPVKRVFLISWALSLLCPQLTLSLLFCSCTRDFWTNPESSGNGLSLSLLPGLMVFRHPPNQHLRSGRAHSVGTHMKKSRSIASLCEATILLQKSSLFHIAFLKSLNVSASFDNAHLTHLVSVPATDADRLFSVASGNQSLSSHP